MAEELPEFIEKERPEQYVLDVAGRQIRISPKGFETINCGGGWEDGSDPTTGGHELPDDKSLPGKQAVVNMVAYFMAWAKDCYGVLPEGKTSDDIASRSELCRRGGERTYIIYESETAISIMFIGINFTCSDGAWVISEQNDPDTNEPYKHTLQDWLNRGPAILDLNAAFGLTPMAAGE